MKHNAAMTDRQTTMTIEAWHFLPNNRRLLQGTREVVYPGKTIRVEGHPVLCYWGLHASHRIIDALTYAPGALLCRVVVGGDIVEGGDKLVGTERTVLWMTDADEMLRQFACLQALSAAHFWDMPDVMRRYLRTQNETARVAARVAAGDTTMDVARATAWAAAGDAAWYAAKAAAGDAAWDAAKAAAWAATGDADWYAAKATAWAATRGAAWDAARATANSQLERMAWMLCGPETALKSGFRPNEQQQ